VKHHPIITVRCIFLFYPFYFLFSDDRWNDDDSNFGSTNTTKKKDFVELDGRWRSTNPSIFEEGFNKAEDIAHKVKELVLDQRNPSHDYSPEIR
jgi:hypothetical protein